MANANPERRLNFGSMDEEFPFNLFVEEIHEWEISNLGYKKCLTVEQESCDQFEKEIDQVSESLKKLSNTFIQQKAQEYFLNELENISPVDRKEDIQEIKDHLEVMKKEIKVIKQQNKDMSRKITDQVHDISNEHFKVMANKNELEKKLELIKEHIKEDAQQKKETEKVIEKPENKENSEVKPNSTLSTKEMISWYESMNAFIAKLFGIKVYRYENDAVIFAIADGNCEEKWLLRVKYCLSATTITGAEVTPKSGLDISTIVDYAVKKNDLEFLVREIMYKLSTRTSTISY